MEEGVIRLLHVGIQRQRGSGNGGGHIVTKEEATFPATPFLLLDDPRVSNKAFIVESWKETGIQVLEDCHFMQKIEFKGHKATEEEIERFMEGEYNNEK